MFFLQASVRIHRSPCLHPAVVVHAPVHHARGGSEAEQPPAVLLHRPPAAPGLTRPHEAGSQRGQMQGGQAVLLTAVVHKINLIYDN